MTVAFLKGGRTLPTAMPVDVQKILFYTSFTKTCAEFIWKDILLT